MYTVFCPDVDREKVMRQARGVYQRSLLCGAESWEGHTLSGPSQEWPDSYAASREGLLGRLRSAGFELTFEEINGRKVLIVGANRPSVWGRLIDEPSEDVLEEARRFELMSQTFMNETHAEAFTDFPEKPECPPHMPDASECPRCQGHGGWNLRLNAYPLHGLADTPANRHRNSHFRASCPQCNGYGWTYDTECIHDFVRVGSVAMHQHIDKCQKCGLEQVCDSSG